MLKRTTLKFALSFALMALGFNAFSEGRNTPIEAMVMREQGIRTFTPVTGIWQADNVFDQTALITNVSKVQPLTIDFSRLSSLVESRYPAIQLVVPKTGGGTYTLNLVKYDFFADGFSVAEESNGISTNFNYTPGVYYRGTVDGIKGSVCGFSFFNNVAYGIFSIPGEGNYSVVPNTLTGKADGNQHYILYNDADLLIKSKGPGCSTSDRLPFSNRAAGKLTTNTNEKVYSTCKEVRVYEVADYSFYAAQSSSSTNVTNYLTSLFNYESILYKNERVLVTLKHIQINTASDVYMTVTNDSHAFLDTFAKTIQNGFLSSPNTSDLAMLFSTRYNASLGGVAYLQSLCSSYQNQGNNYYGPYAFCNIDMGLGSTTFPTYVWDVEVSTHEMGHILGSPHTHACCWNPPGTGTTAIDGCYTLEGSCAMPSPQYPTAGGTIMSYCHLTSTGINFSNGFGTQPGDTIRTFTSNSLSSGCGISYTLFNAIVAPNKTLSANRECTDPVSNYTYYFNDNNTAIQTDDTLVAIIKKNGNDIGTLDNTGFIVSSTTLTGFGGHSGVSTSFPTGTPNILAHSYAMRRYLRINATTQPISNVQVMLPFTKTDTSDLHGSTTITPYSFSNLYLYKLNSTTIDPNPVNNFPGATSSKFNIYSFGNSASTSIWSYTFTSAGTYLANFLTTNLTGGASLFLTYGATAVENTAGAGNISVYPNPINDQWMISIPNSITDALTMQLYSADGKFVRVQLLESGSLNKISTSTLAPGLYFYRIVGTNSMYTGSVLKQ